MTTKFYSAKSKATRALRDTYNLQNEDIIANLLVQGDDGRWGFDPLFAANMESETRAANDDTDAQNLAGAFAEANNLEVVALVAGGVVAEDFEGSRTKILATDVVPATPITTSAPTVATVTAAVAVKKLSAKNHIRNLMSTKQRFTMQEMMFGGRYSEANIRTALSDLKNKLYADGAVLIVKRTRTDNVDYYSL